MALQEHTSNHPAGTITLPAGGRQLTPSTKPLVRLARESDPDDPFTLADTARETRLALLSSGAQLYRRDTIVLFPDPTGRPLMQPMDPKAFRTWAHEFLLFYIETFDRQMMRFVRKVRDCSTSEAETILISPQFWPHLPEIRRTHPLPMPVIRATGQLELLPYGYDRETKIFTFRP